MVATFTRHALTPTQIAEIGERYARAVHFTALAGRTLGSLEEARAVWQEMCAVLRDCGHGCEVDLYGVIPVVLRAVILEEDVREDMHETGHWLTILEALNVQRPQEGGKPSFEHRCWLCTGVYKPRSLQGENG